MTRHIGASIPRVEDDRFLRGVGLFIADIHLEGMAEAVIARSPEAHGILRSIDLQESMEVDGVVGSFMARDLPDAARRLDRPFYQLTDGFVNRHEVMLRPSSEPVLAADRVRRVGEPLALVLAEDRYAAEDARERVQVDVEPLPVVTNPELALRATTMQIDPMVSGNLQGRFHVVVGSPELETAAADRRVSRRFRIGRAAGSPIENRGVVSNYEGGVLTVWSTTQIPHRLRSELSSMLGLHQESIRVIAPDMGGSFGGGIYPEEVLIPWAAMKLGRPVRWLEERGEELTNSRHSRDQLIDAELAFDDDGRFRALTVRVLQDCGAVNPFGITLPFNLVSHIRGQYLIPHFEAEGLCVLTNKTRNTPVRGAGRPEATFVMERLAEMAALAVDLDSDEIRRRNLIPADQMPYDMGMLYRDGNPLVYDSGDFPDQLETALREADYPALRRMQAEARHMGRRIGIGIGGHVEGTGLGPQETAEVRVETNGRVVVRSGSQPHGQSHLTTLSQVCADVLDVDPTQVIVMAGDTALVPTGVGTFGSRSAVTAGSAVHIASTEVRRQILELAAETMEVAVDDLTMKDGKVWPRGVPDAAVTFAHLALVAGQNPQPGDLKPVGLSFLESFAPPSVTFGSGTQVAVVEVDMATGFVDVLEIFVVDDCGTMLNPMVVDGQQHGGVVHGLGNILLEEVQYTSDGQPVSVTFMDYLLPTAADAPRVVVIHRPHPTPLNPIGAKGTGEGATSSTPAAIANAIVDALPELDIEINEMPITTERLLTMIEESSTRGSKSAPPQEDAL
jgi:aerobic carbon-monoxide dehydrogenase large subunit